MHTREQNGSKYPQKVKQQIKGGIIVKRRKGLAFILALSLVLSSFSVAFATDVAEETTPVTESTTEAVAPVATATNTAFADIAGHWAKDAIVKWADYGVVKGSDGVFRPDAPLTRAEMAAVLSNLMDYKVAAKNNFSDVATGAWYADAVLKANAAGVLSGDGSGLASPSANITREQATSMLARAFAVADANGTSSSLTDTQNISSWARPAVFGMEAAGYVRGFEGKFNPKNNITRAEVMAIINSAVKAYYTAAGTYTENVDGLAVVKVPGVVLKDVVISGNLIAAEGIASGDLTLDGKTEVKGKLIVRGGGENSIIIKGSAAVLSIEVSKVDGKVRIFADGALIKEITALKGEIILEGNFTNVEAKADATVIIKGNVGTLSMESKGTVDIQSGTVTTLDIPAGATATIAANATVTTANITGAADIKGTGAIGTANISGTGATIVQTPTAVNIADGGAATVGGKTVDGATSAAPSTGGGSGGGGNSSNTVAVSAISINKSTTTLVEGTTETLTVTFTPSNASNKTITWTTSDASKVTIDSTGKVRAVSAGTATITAKSNNGKTATCVVTVTTTVVPVSAITVTGDGPVVNGKTLQMGVDITPTTATNKKVTWSVTNGTGSATINSSGLLTATGVGTVTVKAAAQDGSGKENTKEITIIAAPVTDAEKVATAKANLSLGDIGAIVANMILPTIQNDATVSWASDNTAVVANNGNVTRPAFGSSDATVTLTATITVGSASDTKAFTVTVKAKAATQYTLTLTGDNITSTPVAGVMDENTSVTITVTPATGQQVKTFTVGGVDKKTELVANKYTFKINANTTVAVTYEAIPVTDAEKVAIAKANLDLGAIDELKGNMTLPTVQNDATVTWASSNPSVITTDGIVTRPEIGSGNATVTLTATITVGSSSDTKVFTATVLAKVVALKEITGFTALTAVDLNTDENLVDLTALKGSGKLPTKVIVTDGITPADATITDWLGIFDGTTGAKTLIAVWTMPDGYIDEAEAINVEVTVNVKTAQTSGSLLPSTIVFANGTEVSKIFGDDPFTNAITGDGEGTITYTSGTPGTATIDSTGKVTIVGVGTTVISATKAATATHATVTATYTLTVTAAPVLGTLSPTVTPGDGKVVLSAMSETGYTFYYKNTTASDSANKPSLDSSNLTGWTVFTSNTDISGTNGTSIFVQVIKVATDGNKIKAWGEKSATPAPVSVTGVSLNQTTMSLKVGTGTGTLTATIAPANATNKTVNWSSSNEAVATVDSNGLITPVAVGETTITVKTTDGNYEAICTVTVTAANVATAVIVDGNGLVNTLNKDYPYWVNGAHSKTGTLGSEGCTAFFDHLTGILTLHGYNGGEIKSSFADKPDLIIKLIGDNKVIGTQTGISNDDNGDIYITADNDATLTVNTVSADSFSFAISSKSDASGSAGSVVIGGKANVVVSAISGNNNLVAGIYARDHVTIQDSANFSSITTVGASGVSYSYGIRAGKNITINTTGDISIDCSGSQNGTAIYANDSTHINNVHLMTLKSAIKASYGNGFIGKFSNFPLTISDAANNLDETGKILSYRSGTPYTIEVKNGEITGVAAGVFEAGQLYQALANDTITIKSKTIPLFEFVKWTNQDGTALDSSLFVSPTAANSSVAKIKMPANNLNIKAQYKSTLFTTQPVFHRGDEKITWKISQAADFGYLQKKTGETWGDTNISLPRTLEGTATIRNNSGNHYEDAPDGTYRLAFYFNPNDNEFLKHYSEEFEILWNALLDGTVTISGTPKYGETLTANVTGTQSDAGDLKYQWFADSTEISGATEKTLVLGADQVGKQIKVKVSSHNYNMPIESVATVAVAKADGPAAIDSYTGTSEVETNIKLAGLGASTPNLEAAVAIDGSTYDKYRDLSVYGDGKASIIGLTGVNASTKVKVRIKESPTHFAGADREITVTVAAVDKTALTTAITDANTNKVTAVVSTDGFDIDPANKWVTSAEMVAYELAISTAQGVADNTSATQTEVNNAVTTLNTATTTFNDAKKDGIQSPLASFDPVTLTQTGDVAHSNVQYADAAAVIEALPAEIAVKLENSSVVNVPVTWADTDTYNAGTAADYTFTATWGTMPAGANNNNSLAVPTVEVTVEDRAKITNVVATSTIKAPVYGEMIVNPTFTITEGSPAHLDTAKYWQKKIDDKWEYIYSGNFTEGIWRFTCQVRIDDKVFDGNDGTTHKLASPLTVMVGEDVWLKDGTPSIYDTYSFGWVSSPVYEVTAPVGTELTFKTPPYSVPLNISGQSITPYSVASFAEGGKKPYKFSKISGPEWINVLEAGDINGTPTTAGTNSDLVIRVTDALDAYKEITINVGKTVINPSDRIDVTNVVATSTIKAPVYGETIVTPKFTITEGSPAHLDSSKYWQKKIDDNWVDVTSGKFTEGTWRFICQVRIDAKVFDGNDGTTHKLASPLTVTVGEDVWLKDGTPSIYDTYSFGWVNSPEYVVTNS